MSEINEKKEKQTFRPYIPADRVLPEFTVTSIILGIALAVVFGAANAYLVLRVGLTVSAAIPAAVISMGFLRLFLKRKSILENNMVQTVGSAGESLAAGAIFTLPALFMWAAEDPAELSGRRSGAERASSVAGARGRHGGGGHGAYRLLCPHRAGGF